jgi:hypothetical protein
MAVYEASTRGLPHPALSAPACSTSRRLDINCIRSWRNRFREFDDRHRRHFAEQLWQLARMMRIEMLHDHKRHSGFGRQMAQQFHRRFESASRAADTDNRAARFSRFLSTPRRLDLTIANSRRAALFLLCLRGHTLTFRSRSHVLNNDLQLARVQAAIPS